MTGLPQTIGIFGHAFDLERLGKDLIAIPHVLLPLRLRQGCRRRDLAADAGARGVALCLELRERRLLEPHAGLMAREERHADRQLRRASRYRTRVRCFGSGRPPASRRALASRARARSLLAALPLFAPPARAPRSRLPPGRWRPAPRAPIRYRVPSPRWTACPAASRGGRSTGCAPRPRSPGRWPCRFRLAPAPTVTVPAPAAGCCRHRTVAGRHRAPGRRCREARSVVTSLASAATRSK